MPYFYADLKQLSYYLTKNRHDYMGYIILCDQNKFPQMKFWLLFSCLRLLVYKTNLKLFLLTRPFIIAHHLMSVLIPGLTFHLSCFRLPQLSQICCRELPVFPKRCSTISCLFVIPVLLFVSKNNLANIMVL